MSPRRGNAVVFNTSNNNQDHNYNITINNKTNSNNNEDHDYCRSNNNSSEEDYSKTNSNNNEDHDYCSNNNSSETQDYIRKLIRNSETTIKKYVKVKKQNIELRKIIRRLKSKKYLNQQLSAMLSGKTNPATAAMLVTGGRGKKKYTREDVAVAAVIRATSRRTYKMLRKKKLLKLPGETTIKNWLKHINLRCNGVQQSLLDILKAKKTTDRDRHIILSFDEMEIKECWIYDARNKEVIPPAKKLQVVMVRSLISGWKIPIYFKLDTNMTIEILSQITRSLEQEGFLVHGASFDLGNKTFMSEAKFSKGEYYIEHPVDPTRRFYLLPDPPHTLKLSRTHILTKVIIFIQMHKAKTH